MQMGLRTILIYIILKHNGFIPTPSEGLRTILIYIILKRAMVAASDSPKIKNHINLHHSQTDEFDSR